MIFSIGHVGPIALLYHASGNISRCTFHYEQLVTHLVIVFVSSIKYKWYGRLVFGYPDYDWPLIPHNDVPKKKMGKDI